jgi:flagellar basal-body rod protein FlgF
MENALLVGLSRQMTLRRELETVANNVANVNTAGFKADRLVFAEYMRNPARIDAQARAADRPVRFVIDPRTATNHETGTLDRTGGETDLALQGDGFFAVETQRGERYTRAGAFLLNAQGELVTPRGDRVLTEGGPIAFTPADGRISIAADGTISTQQGLRGRLRVAAFADPSRLRKEGDNLFAAPDGVRPEPAPQARVLQGAVERSNVSAVTEVARLVEITRSYQSISQVLDRTQDLRRTALERLAQLP